MTSPAALPPAGDAPAQTPPPTAALAAVGAFLIAAAGFVLFSAVREVPLYPDARGLVFPEGAPLSTAHYPEALQQQPYAPLSVLTLGLGHWLMPGSSLGVLGPNLLLHLVAAVLVYVVTRRLLAGRVDDPWPIAAGLLFVVHPMNVGVLSLATGRAPLLAAVCLLAGLWCALPKREGAEPSWSSLAFACIFALAATTAHFAAVVGPFVFAAAVWIARPPGNTGNHFPVAVAGLALGVAQVILLVAAGAISYETAQGISGVMSAQGLAMSSLLANYFAPHGLYPIVEATTGFSSLGVATMLAAALGGLALCALRQPLGLGLLLAALTAMAAPCVLPLEIAQHPHLAYLAGVMLPVSLVACVAYIPLAPARLALAGILLIVSGVAGILSFNAIVPWADAPSLWLQTSERFPQSALPHRELARLAEALAAQAATPEEAKSPLLQAADQWSAAVEREPGDAASQTGLGRTLLQSQRGEEAIAPLEAALRLDPFRQEPKLLLALAAAAQGRNDPEAARRALTYFDAAAKDGPLLPQAEQPYIATLLAVGDIERALPRVQAVAEATKDQNAMQLAQQLQAGVKRIQSLEAEAAQTLAKDPADLTALTRRAEAQVARGRLLQAGYWLDTILRRDPNTPDAWPLLATLRARQGEIERFLAQWGEKGPADLNTWKAVAGRLALAGQWDAAEALLRAGASRQGEGQRAEFLLAELALERNDTERARKFLEAAAAAAPGDPAPLLRLADVEVAAGNAEAARSRLEAAAAAGAAEEALAERRTKIEEIGKAKEPVRTILQ